MVRIECRETTRHSAAIWRLVVVDEVFLHLDLKSDEGRNSYWPERKAGWRRSPRKAHWASWNDVSNQSCLWEDTHPNLMLIPPLSPATALFGQTQQETRGHGSLDDVVFVGQLSKTEQNGENGKTRKRQTEGIQCITTHKKNELTVIIDYRLFLWIDM